MILEPLRPGDWTAALDCALSRVPEEERALRVQHFLTMLGSNLFDPRGIWVAREGRRILAVQVTVPLAGAACLFWLPSTIHDPADALIRAALGWYRAEGCKIAQALVRPGEEAWAAPLTRQGFRTITKLHQLTHDLTNLPAINVDALRLVHYDRCEERLFAETLERTYQGTRDCPELNGVRTIDEILAGHRAQGRFESSRWWLATAHDLPIGVLMLTELLDGATWELAYVGLVPEARGQGLGRTLMLHAMHTLAHSDAMALTLAVDTRNTPARRLYESLGFVEAETSGVLLYLW